MPGSSTTTPPRRSCDPCLTAIFMRSARRAAGAACRDYIALHQWFDESKKIIADPRHRALRHHAEGIFLLETIFRSEEHTSELQSLMRISYAVFCLKKKKKTNTNNERQ